MTQELPEKETKLLKNLRKKYKISFEPFQARDTRLEILQVTDLEPLLAGKDPFKNMAEFPFWSRIWEATIILADLMASTPPAPGQTLLELGAGFGVPGLVAAANGYKVTLSDYEQHIIDFERVSAAANGLSDIDFKLIDWNSPPDLPRFNTIIGAEILYREDFFQPLLNVFDKLLAEDGTIFLAHDGRRRNTEKFLNLASKKFAIAARSVKVTFDDEERNIILNRLKPLSS